MNRKAIKMVRDHIAGLEPRRFNMLDPRRGDRACDSAACIGGWALVVVGGPKDYGMDTARRLLGLPSDALFYPVVSDAICNSPGFKSPFDASPADAVRVLDHLLETGGGRLVDYLPAGSRRREPMTPTRIPTTTSTAFDSLKARMARAYAATSGISTTEAGLAKARDELRAMIPEIEAVLSDLDAMLPKPAAPVLPFKRRAR